MSIMVILAGVAIWAVWLVICCIVISKTEKQKRTAKYVVTVILFVLCAASYCGIQIGAAKARNAVRNSAVLVNEYLQENYSDVQVVNPGVEVEKLPQAINDLEDIVPKNLSELGNDGVLYGSFLDNLYKRAVSRGFAMLRSRTDRITRLAGDDGIITASEIIEAPVSEINLIIRRIVFYTILINAIIPAILLCVWIIQAIKRSKSQAE